MVLLAFVLAQTRSVNLPSEFVELTKVAAELSRASGKEYRIDPSLSREIVYLSTKEWSVENVAKRVATTFRAEWQQEGEGYVFRRDPKVLAKMRDEETHLINQRIDEQLEADYKSVLRDLQGDTLVRRKQLAEAHKKFPPITEDTTSISEEENQLTLAALKLVPELRVGLDAFKKIPRKIWLSRPVLSRTHFADFRHAFARTLEVEPASRNYVVDQTNRDAAYYESLPAKERDNLPFEVRVHLRSKPLMGQPRFWLSIFQESPTKISVGLTSYTSDYKYLGEGGATFNLATRSDFSRIPNLEKIRDRKVGVAQYAAEYIKGPSFKKLELEPAQLIYGALLKELSAENPELAVCVPDDLDIYDKDILDALLKQPKSVGAMLQTLSDYVSWKVDEQGCVFARPQFQLRHEAVRSNRPAVRKLLRVALTSPAVSLEDGLEYAKNAPLSQYASYLSNVAIFYGINLIDSLSMVRDEYHLRTLKLVAELSPQQREMLLRSQSLLFNQLTPEAQRKAYAMIEDGGYGSEYKPVRNDKEIDSESRRFQQPIAFENGLTGKTRLISVAKVKHSLVIRPGALSSFSIMDASSAGYVASQQLRGEWLDPIMGYPIISKATFQPILGVTLNLSIKEGPASLAATLGFNESPGQIVKSIAELPSDFVQEYTKTFQYYEKLRNQRQAIPPLN